MKTKKHWTQTPEGRKRMGEIQNAIQKARQAKRKANGRPIVIVDRENMANIVDSLWLKMPLEEKIRRVSLA